MAEALLLSGPPECGKTTAIRTVLTRVLVEAGGFYTAEIREGGVRTGFCLLTLDGQEAVLAAVETGDPASLQESMASTMAADVPNLVTCACGSAPIMVDMNVARGLGADTISVLHYANSADSPHGDRERVVGYAAVMLWHANHMH